MRDFRPTEQETVSMEGRGIRPNYAAHVGLDVHKNSIAVAVAPAGREPPVYVGEIANRPLAIGKLAEKLARTHGGEVMLFSYEAGPCGYEVYRQLTGWDSIARWWRRRGSRRRRASGSRRTGGTRSSWRGCRAAGS